MNELMIENKSDIGLVVSSRVVAKELGKRHGHVIRDLERILTDPDVDSLIILSNYRDSKGETRKEYLLTKDGFTLYMFNIQGHNDFKRAYINKFNEMERRLKEQKSASPSYLIDDAIERAKRWIEEQEERKQLQLENIQQKEKIEQDRPKVEYHDLILQSQGTLNTSQIAADYELSARRLNEILHEQGIQYKCGKQWLLYSKYKNKGYTESRTGVNGEFSYKQTKWTQKGQLLIYDTLKSVNILPTMDKN